MPGISKLSNKFLAEVRTKATSRGRVLPGVFLIAYQRGFARLEPRLVFRVERFPDGQTSGGKAQHPKPMRQVKLRNTAVITIPNVPRPVRQGLLVSILIFIFTALALRDLGAQTTTSTTTTPALSSVVDGLNLPWGVQILTGTAISSATGAPVRHVWEGDQAGFCRIDPDLDSPGPYAVNTSTCVTSVAGTRYTPGRTAFDPINNIVYTVNNAKAQPVARLHFLPAGDSGQGLIGPSSEFIGDTNGCGVSGNFPWALALGPDGDLYLSFRKNGNLVRVLAPQAPSVPCSSFQVFGATADAKIGKGLAWIGHDLWGADGIGIFHIADADQCFTPVNNFSSCKGITLLRSLVPNPLGIFSDQIYPALNGNNLYVFDPTGTSITLISGVTTPEPTVQPSWVPSILGGLTIAVDNSNPANQVLYLGDDPAVDAPAVVNQGWIDKISNNPATIPDPPNNASAVAGDSQAIVSWTAAGGGTPTSYTVHNSFAANGLTVPDVTVSAAPGSTFVPTVVTVTGLINGVSYQFEISASNTFGTSPFSLPSNPVIPHSVTVPTAPATVVAAAGVGSATVAWTTPANDGGSPIFSYTVTAFSGGVASASAVVPAPATSTAVSGLTNGTTYTFTVHATNAVGNSPESVPSNAVTPNLPLGPTDMAITMSAPASVNAGGNVSYTLTVSNLGPSFAPSLVTSNPIPAGATFVSAVTSLGVCAGPANTTNGGVQCLASGLLPGASLTITVTLNVAATVTNSASVQAFDSAGNPLSDTNPLNNTAIATTTVGPPPTTTDIQVTGAAQNGGPAVGTIDTFTWQIKDNLSIAASGVTFTTKLPAALPFASVSTNIGSCSGPLPGTAGTVTCSAPTIAGGQTMIVIVNASVAAAGTIPVVGIASLTGTDTNPANNLFTVTINAK